MNVLGKASEVKIEMVDADSVGELQNSINKWLSDYAPKNAEVLEIKYNMLTDPACDDLLYMTAMIIYKEGEQVG